MAGCESLPEPLRGTLQEERERDGLRAGQRILLDLLNYLPPPVGAHSVKNAATIVVLRRP